MRRVTHAEIPQLHEGARSPDAAPTSCKNSCVANPDRLSGLDSSFLHLERDAVHMHVAACAIFEGEPPSHAELVEAIESRLHLVPRYRQRLAFVPLSQGRPVWVDDPYFNLAFHLRHSALPAPGPRSS